MGIIEYSIQPTTMSLLEYLNFPRQVVPAAKGSLPTKHEWVDFADFELKGTRLCFSDSWCPFDGVFVPMTPGKYVVKALCAAYGPEVRVAALRAERAGTSGIPGEAVGEFGVDVGAVGITDIDIIEAMSEEVYTEWIELYSYANENPAAGVHPCPEADTKMLFTNCGWGDGVYAVYPVIEEGIVVGAEARFLEMDEPYPFPFDPTER